MKKTIPLAFLLCTILILLMAFAHWIWKDGLADIYRRQNAVMSQTVSENEASLLSSDAWQTRLERVFADSPDLGILLVRDREHKPLFLRSRLPQAETRLFFEPAGVPGTNAGASTSLLEIRLPNGQSGSVLFAWTDLVTEAHTRRMLVIAIVAAVLIILGWSMAAILLSLVKKKKLPLPVPEEELDPIEILSERNKRLSEEIEDLSGLREVSILAGKETSLGSLMQLAGGILASRANTDLRWIAISRTPPLSTMDSRIRCLTPERFSRLETLLGNGLRHKQALLVPLSSNGKPWGIACLRCTPEDDQRAVQYIRQFSSPLCSFLLRDLAENDSLTGLASRRSFDEILARHTRNETALPLALILADIDHFKEVNDSLGHQAGDLVLKQAAGVLKNSAPKTASCCRYGGEEFAIILPGTALPEAVSLAETMRMEIATAGMLQHRSVTASFGVAVAATRHEAEPALIIERADSALYFSKQHGRNMVSSQTASSSGDNDALLKQ